MKKGKNEWMFAERANNKSNSINNFILWEIQVQLKPHKILIKVLLDGCGDQSSDLRLHVWLDSSGEHALNLLLQIHQVVRLFAVLLSEVVLGVCLEVHVFDPDSDVASLVQLHDQVVQLHFDGKGAGVDREDGLDVEQTNRIGREPTLVEQELHRVQGLGRAPKFDDGLVKTLDVLDRHDVFRVSLQTLLEL